jgi:hypothetical protein
MRKTTTREERKGEGSCPPSSDNHTNGGGRPHKEVGLYQERRRSFSHFSERSGNYTKTTFSLYTLEKEELLSF